MKKSVPSRPAQGGGFFHRGPAVQKKLLVMGAGLPMRKTGNQLSLAVIGGIFPPNFPPWRANGRSCSIYPEA